MLERTPTGTLNSLDNTGHTSVSWNKDTPAEVESAKAAYDALVAKGYTGFRVQGDGKQGQRLSAFDPAAEEILMVPRLQGG